jgi:hypothetical protein
MIDIQESLLRDVGVDLRCREIAVTQQFLDAPQIGTAIEQVGGKAMA